MLIAPSLQNYRNGEFVKFIANSLTICSKYDLATLNLAEKHTALEQAHQSLKALFKVDRGSDLTKEIIRLDKERDSDFTGIIGIVELYANNHYDETMVNAATSLLKVLESHGRSLVRLSYQQQTAAMEDIITRIEAGHVAELTTLNLADWFAHMKNANDQFNVKFLERNQEYAQAPKEKLTAVREQTTNAYQELAKFINAYAVIGTTADYEPLINELNALINNYNAVVNRRKAGSSAEAEAENLDADFDEVVA